MPKGRLGTLFASRRQAAGMTQWDVAAAARHSVTREAIAQIERGKTQAIGPDTANRLAEAIPGLTVEEICRAMGYNITADAADAFKEADPDAIKALIQYPPEAQRFILLRLLPLVEEGLRGLRRRVDGGGSI